MEFFVIIEVDVLLPFLPPHLNLSGFILVTLKQIYLDILAVFRNYINYN